MTIDYDAALQWFAEHGSSTPLHGHAYAIRHALELAKKAQSAPVMDVFAEMKEKYGDCCKGGSPHCAAECQVERCIKRDAASGHLKTPSMQDDFDKFVEMLEREPQYKPRMTELLRNTSPPPVAIDLAALERAVADLNGDVPALENGKVESIRITIRPSSIVTIRALLGQAIAAQKGGV